MVPGLPSYTQNLAPPSLNSVKTVLINPLNTDDVCKHYVTLATSYKLTQSILKIGLCGIGGGG